MVDVAPAVMSVVAVPVSSSAHILMSRLSAEQVQNNHLDRGELKSRSIKESQDIPIHDYWHIARRMARKNMEVV